MKKTVTKKVVKKPAKKAVKKPVAKKAAPKKVVPKKATKPIQKKAVKATSQKKGLKRADAKSPKKSGGKSKKKVAPTIPTRITRAETLRKKNLVDMGRLDKIQKEWEKKVNSAKDKTEIKSINKQYDAKFRLQEKREEKSYAAYYNHVQKNFTKEQQKAAWKNSNDFMSKKYTNGLLKAVRDEEKR